jgi:hypothetical protein
MLAAGDSSGVLSSTGMERRIEGTLPVARVVSVLIAFAVCLRLAHLVLVAPTPLVGFHKEFVDSDMWFFDQWVQRIVAGDWLGRERFHPLAAWQLGAAPAAKWLEWYGSAPTFYKAPFYAYLLAALSFLGAPALSVFFLQAVAAGFSAWILFRISRDMFGDVAAVFAVALFALYGPDIHFTTVMLRGPWIVLSSLLVTDRLLVFSHRPSAAQAALAGLSVAVAIVINEAMTPLVILAPLAFLLAGPPRDRALKACGGFAAGTLAGLAPVVIRNLVVGAPPFQIAVTGTVVLAVFNSASSDPLLFSARPENFAPVMNLAGVSVFQTLLACARSFSSVSDWLGFYALKLAGLVAPFENPDNVNFYYAAVVNPWLGLLPAYGVLLPLALSGALLAWPTRRASWWCWMPPPLTLLAAMLLTLPLSRYRAVWAIHLMPFAGLALSRAASWARARSFARLGALLIALAFAAGAQHAIQQEVFWGARRAQSLTYRPAEFVLAARMEASTGRFAEAAREMDRLAELHPEAGVKLQAMTLAAQYRDQERASKGAAHDR